MSDRRRHARDWDRRWSSDCSSQARLNPREQVGDFIGMTRIEQTGGHQRHRRRSHLDDVLASELAHVRGDIKVRLDLHLLRVVVDQATGHDGAVFEFQQRRGVLIADDLAGLGDMRHQLARRELVRRERQVRPGHPAFTSEEMTRQATDFAIQRLAASEVSFALQQRLDFVEQHVGVPVLHEQARSQRRFGPVLGSRIQDRFQRGLLSVRQ